MPLCIPPSLLHRGRGLRVTSRGLRSGEKRRYSIQRQKSIHRPGLTDRASNPPIMTHLGFTSLTSRFNLSVRERVGGVEAVVLSIDQSNLPSDYLVSDCHIEPPEYRNSTHPLLVAHMISGVHLEVEALPVPRVEGSVALSDLCRYSRSSDWLPLVGGSTVGSPWISSPVPAAGGEALPLQSAPR